MEQWLETGIHQVNSVLAKDAEFQILLAQLIAAEAQYRAIINRLSPEDQLCIENYVALCEETEYQKTLTAYYCGKQNG